MATELFQEIMNRAVGLTPREKLRLAAILSEQVGEDQAGNGDNRGINLPGASVEERQRHLAWLKAHREQYSGQYVALDGDRLVGNGLTMFEAVAQARENDCSHPFVAYLLAKDVIADGGL